MTRVSVLVINPPPFDPRRDPATLIGGSESAEVVFFSPKVSITLHSYPQISIILHNGDEVIAAGFHHHQSSRLPKVPSLSQMISPTNMKSLNHACDG